MFTTITQQPTASGSEASIHDHSNNFTTETAPSERTATVKDWGVQRGYWLWPTVIRILLVIDGRINLSKSQYEFGLGYVLDTLATPLSWWVRFEVDIARRIDVLDSPFALDGHEIKYQQFKFTDPGFNIDAYDQLWLFGDMPNFDDGSDTGSTDADIPTFALTDAELKIVAEWMDRGGGIFATGDHSVLGASLSSRIPRVRTMRRWRKAEGTPTRDGLERNETLQPLTSPGDPETDPIMQPVELIYQPAPGPLPFGHRVMPHPVLCSPIGPIDLFPDHMHEGELYSDTDVVLDRPLDIPNYTRPEYPVGVDGAGNPIQPKPHVVAYGRTTHINFSNDPTAAFKGPIPFRQKRFGLVGVYDGDRAGIGRVVVDSTWHHWLSINLTAHAQFSVPLGRYQKMQAYYRNVGLWLARPGLRQTMVVAAAWGILAGSAPMEFSRNDNEWEIGERLLNVFANTASPCIRDFLTDSVLDGTLLTVSARSAHGSEPAWGDIPVELKNRAAFAGIGKALLDLAVAHRHARAMGERPPLDARAIQERAIKGISLAQKLVAKTVDDAARVFKEMNSRLKKSRPVPAVINVPSTIDVRE